MQTRLARIALLLVASVFALLDSNSVLAQTNTTALCGAVTDASGAVVAEATVTYPIYLSETMYR